MIINNELILGLLASFVAVFGVVFGYLQNKNEKRQKKRTEAQKQIGLLRNELEQLKAEKDEAHDALTRQMADCMYLDNDKEKLKPLIKAACEVKDEYRAKEQHLYAEMRRLWEES